MGDDVDEALGRPAENLVATEPEETADEDIEGIDLAKRTLP